MDPAERRAAMVERQLRRRGIVDERVLAAMGSVPREHFVPDRIRHRAYDDGALAIGHDQTISQPWVVAAIVQALGLDGEEKVLEIGTGSGYSAAVLASIADRVYSVERIAELAEEARERIAELDLGNVEVIVGDGTRGHPDAAPYDAIAVHATAPDAPRSLLEQLRVGGTLVIPIASGRADMLTAFHKEDGGLRGETIGPCRFVPLIGVEGFGDSEAD
jgi:protein-L-isoaspartate(D-aspartate) O-methyltransferase